MAQHLGKNLVIAATLIGAGFAIAWLRFRPYLGDSAELTDGSRHIASQTDSLRYAIWDAPTAWPEDAQPGNGVDTAPAFSDDGRFAVFAAGRSDERRDLYLVEIDGGRIGSSEPLSKLNSAYDEISPAIVGDKIYFASNRPKAPSEGKPASGATSDFDLFVADFKNGNVSDPRPLPASINTSADERDPCPLADGKGLVFSANPQDGVRRDFDLFLAESTAATGDAFRVSRLSSLSSTADDLEPHLSRDGRMLVFASDREGGDGGFDLYRSLRENGGFRAPERVTGLSTADDDRSPHFVDDGFTLVFERRTVDPNSKLVAIHLLRAKSIELFKVPGRPVGWMEILFVASLLLTALLAWLAKRWDTVDVIYKCFLVAIVVHLALLWWSQRVPVEPKDMTLAERHEGLFQVRVASAMSRANASAERGGKLDVARPASGGKELAAAHPDRAANVTTGDGAMPAAAPGSIALTRGTNGAETVAPNRGDSGASGRAKAAPGTPSVALSDRGPELPKNTQVAPGLEVGGPATTNAARPASSLAAAAGPTHVESAPRAAAESAGGAGGTGGAGPAALALGRGARNDAAAAPSPGASLTGDLGFGGNSGGRTVDVALADGETFAPASSTGSSKDLSIGDLNPAAFSRDEIAAGGSEGGANGSAGSSGSGGPTRASIASKGASDTGASGLEGAPQLAPVALKGGTGGTDTGAPGRETVAFERVGKPGTETGTDGGFAIAAPQDASRPAMVSGPPIGDSLALDPVAFDGAGRGNDSGGSSGNSGPSRYQLGAAADLAPSSSGSGPAPLEFARAEAKIDATPSAGDSAFEHTPYRSRFGLEKELALKTNGGSAETERAVAQGLAYLASQQTDDGCFGDAQKYDEKYGYVVVGKTGLCLLAFLGAGHTPTSNTQYSQVAAKAVAFIEGVQTESGHFGWTSAYSHGIGTYALAECYALTKDESIRPTLERAVKHILDNQAKGNDPRNSGGWGYFNPEGPHYDRWSRVSVSAWQVMALESARLSGIEVPDRAFDRAKVFLESAYDGQYGYFRYNHDPDRLNEGYRTLPGSTPAALFALALLGDDITSSDYDAPRKFVLDRVPKEYRWRGEDAFVEQATGNLYFWYYGTLSMFRAGGTNWSRWNEGMKKVLLGAQAKDGSWKPIDSYADHAGDSPTSRCYTTAMCTLTLEVYYRYFTPLLKVR